MRLKRMFTGYIKIVTRLWARRPEPDPRQGQWRNIFSPPPRSDQLRGPPSPTSSGRHGLDGRVSGIRFSAEAGNFSPLHRAQTGLEQNTRAVCKICGLTLLLRVRTLWRCDDGLFFEVPPLASNALLTAFHPLLETCYRPFAAVFRRIVEQAVFLPRSTIFMAGKAQKSHGARFGLHRPDGWVVEFVIHFFKAEHRIQSLTFH